MKRSVIRNVCYPEDPGLQNKSMYSALLASLWLFKYIPDEFVDPIEFSLFQGIRATGYIINNSDLKTLTDAVNRDLISLDNY